MNKEHTYAAQMELTNIPEDSLKQWTNMPPISEELYNELVKEFNNERKYFFNDSYILEVLISNLNDKQLDIMEDLIVNQYGD